MTRSDRGAPRDVYGVPALCGAFPNLPVGSREKKQVLDAFFPSDQNGLYTQ
jgi:hypothetical protein